MVNDVCAELLEICRTCLSKCEHLLPLKAVIDEDNFNVKDYLKKYVQLECIEDDHPMPENICLKCFERLIEVRNYYIQCQEAEKYLKLKISLPHPTKGQHIEIKFEILHDRNDIDSFENFEILDENDLLEFENNDDYEVVVEQSDSLLNEKIDGKFQDLEEFQYLTEKCQNMDAIFGDANVKSENIITDFESLTEKSQNMDVTESSHNMDVISEDLDLKSRSSDFEKLEEIAENSDQKNRKFVKNIKNTFIKCVGCNSIYNTLSEFQNHDCVNQKPKEHDNVEPTDSSVNTTITRSCRHRCQFCECSFGNLQRHMTLSHENIKFGNFEKSELFNLSLGCLNCDKQYISKKPIKNHISRYKRNKQQFVCTQCGKIYNNAQSMKEHEYAHKGIKPYKCEYCGREFAHECVRRAHLKLHTGKDIICPVCNKTFAAQSQLRIHMTYHTNDLKFPCDMCPKRFRRNHVLQLHRKSHTGRKTEQCEYCDSCFYTKDDLRGHIYSVHLKRYHCNLCKNRYSEPGRLRNHFLKVHNIEIEDVTFYKKNVNELEILMRTRK